MKVVDFSKAYALPDEVRADVLSAACNIAEKMARKTGSISVEEFQAVRSLFDKRHGSSVGKQAFDAFASIIAQLCGGKA